MTRNRISKLMIKATMVSNNESIIGKIPMSVVAPDNRNNPSDRKSIWKFYGLFYVKK